MSRSGAPEGFEIAALRKRQVEVWDPMAHGPGTPWEDRATQGTVGAFFKTAIASMTRPRQLAADLRRPETTGDARGFVIGCSIPWGISAAYHVGWALYYKAHHPELLDKKIELDNGLGGYNGLWLGIDLTVALVGGAIGVVLLWTLLTAIYNHLIQQEARTVKVTEPLVANVAAYAFGPSLLALIPLVGPPLALVVMLAVMIGTGGNQRLRLRLPAAVIDALLSFLAVVAIAFVSSFALWVLSDRLIPSAVPTVEKTVNEANQPAIRPSIP